MAERYGRPIDPNPSTPAGSSYEPPDDEASSPSAHASGLRGGVGGERIDSQVQKAQEQLLNLKRQQEQIERQKRELEELSRRQEELEQGRAEMSEKLTRALVVVERQTSEAQKRVEQLRATFDSFSGHLSALESINPKSWPSADMQRELSRSLGMVDHARTEYGQQRARFAAEAAEGGAAGDGTISGAGNDSMFGGSSSQNFVYWLKAGVAFTLPIFILGLLALCILCWYIATRPA